MRARLIGLLTAVITASVLALGFTAVSAFERAVEPELANRTRLIGSIVRGEIQRSLEFGVPFDGLVGLDRYLTRTLEQFGEVDRISVQTASGVVIAEAQSPTGPSLLERIGLGEAVDVRRRAFSLPVLAGNELAGMIIVEISPQFVETRLRDVFLDVMVIALVASLVALELILAVTISSVGKPFDRVYRLLMEQSVGDFLHRIRPGGLSGLGRAAARLNDQASDLAERLAAMPAAARARIVELNGLRIAEGTPARLGLSDFSDIRLGLFVFTTATAIGTAFLPLYAQAAIRPDWLPPELAAAAPLALYLVTVAVVSPFGGALARRFGPRRLFLVLAPLTALALVALGLSHSVVAISLWHAATGACFAVVTIACHDYALRAAGREGGTRPAGAFVAVVFGGVFAGSALGGVFAGRFGFSAAFHAAGALAVLSGALAMATMVGRAGDPAGEPGFSPEATLGRRRFGIRAAALLAGITAPMHATTAILIWYLTPLMLAGLGSGPAEIARVVMLYYVAVVLFGPMVVHLSDGRLGPVALIAGGATASGLALLSLELWHGFWAVTVAVAGAGLGHTMIRAPQYAHAAGMTSGAGASLGALRLVERLGALCGLGAAALLLDEAGAAAILRVLGLLVLTGVGAFAIVEASQRSR